MIDRRVGKTLQSLHEALISLILEKGYEATTVGDVIARANVGRSTFYAHYRNKHELLQSGLDELGKQLLANQTSARAAQPAAQRPFAFSQDLFNHTLRYKPVYQAMLGKQAGNIVSERLRQVLKTVIERDLAVTHWHKPDIPTDAFVEFIVGTIMSILTWWVGTRETFSPEQADALFRKLVLPALESDG